MEDQAKKNNPSKLSWARSKVWAPSSVLEEFKKTVESLTVALSLGKKLEKQVLDYVAESIRKIDDSIESYEYSTSKSDPQALEHEKESRLKEIVTNSIRRIQEHITGFKKGKEMKQENNSNNNNTRENGPQGIEQQSWLSRAMENIEGKLKLIAPENRYGVGRHSVHCVPLQSPGDR